MTDGPAGPPYAPLQRPPASLARRLAALVYELLLLVAVTFITGFLLTPLGPRATGGFTVPSASMRALHFVVVFAVLCAYALYFWSGGRRTLPMKTWSLRLLMHDGRPVPVLAALVRYLAAWIGPALALAAYLPLHANGHGGVAALLLGTSIAWSIVDRSGQFLHDRLAGTVLVDARSRSVGAPVVQAS